MSPDRPLGRLIPTNGPKRSHGGVGQNGGKKNPRRDSIPPGVRPSWPLLSRGCGSLLPLGDREQILLGLTLFENVERVHKLGVFRNAATFGG